MGMKDVHTSRGKDDMHLGWLVPGETLCLGAGPVVLRYTREEAVQLASQLHELLGEDCRTCGPGRHSYTSCGCQPPRPEPKSEPSTKSRFFDGPSWGHGSGLPGAGHRVAALG